jgi:hypothetical protein
VAGLALGHDPLRGALEALGVGHGRPPNFITTVLIGAQG